MTRLANSQAVETPVHQYRHLSECETQYQRDLVLEVYRQLFERFGALPDVVLVRLANTSVEQLTGLRFSLYEADSFEGVAAKAGWVLPQGGEGNYPMDVEHHSRVLSCEEQSLVQDRLMSLRGAQLTGGVVASVSADPQDDADRWLQRVTNADCLESVLFTDTP